MTGLKYSHIRRVGEFKKGIEINMALSKNDITIIRSTFLTLLVIIAYLAFIKIKYPVELNLNDKLLHTFGFYVLSLLMDFSFPGSEFRVHKIAPLIAYGIFLEIIQYFIPYRQSEILDVAADSIGIILYMVSVPLVKRVFYLKRRWTIDD